MLPSVVEWVASNLREMVPVKTIRPYQEGIKYTFGLLGGFRDWQKQRGYIKIDARWPFFHKIAPEKIDHKPCKPGWEWYFPFLQQVDVVDVVEETFDLVVQTITTKDNRKISFSINVVWYVKNTILYMTEVQNVEKSMEGASRVFCARVMREWTYADLIEKQTQLESDLKAELNKKSKKWGIHVEIIGFTDFVETKQYRFFGDAPYKPSQSNDS